MWGYPTPTNFQTNLLQGLQQMKCSLRGMVLPTKDVIAHCRDSSHVQKSHRSIKSYDHICKPNRQSPSPMKPLLFLFLLLAIAIVPIPAVDDAVLSNIASVVEGDKHHFSVRFDRCETNQ